MAIGNRKTESRFSRIPSADIPRSQFNRSHTHKTTFDGGGLIPILVEEVIPGDSWNLNMTAFARLATPIYPLMDNARLDFFFFFAPMRILWTNFPKFCGAQDNPADSTDYTVPTSTTVGGVTTGNVQDYMGIPIGKANTTFNNLPMRMYNMIWNEWFRDQDLQNSVTVDLDDGPDTYGSYSAVLKRCKRHDYFTSCRPWVSKGPDVSLSLGDSAAVTTTTTRQLTGAQTPLYMYDATDGGVPPADKVVGTGTTGSEQQLTESTVVGIGTAGNALYPGNLEVDLSSATAATINSLREAFQLQKLFERDARGGTRYAEIIQSHYRVTDPSHAVLQRPQYLGGGTLPLIISAVAQATQKTTAGGWDQTEKGSLAAFGTAAGGQIGFNTSFTEHGYILGLVCATADQTYQNGLHRMWSRSTRYDFYWPALANLGEQSVLQQEIYLQDDTATSPANTDTFGYQERWSEYRYSPSRISGLFRSDAAGTLDPWHLAIDYGATPPELDSSWIQEDPPFDRVIAVPTEPHFIFDSFFQVKCARPMPVYSVPGLIDHF